MRLNAYKKDGDRHFSNIHSDKSSAIMLYFHYSHQFHTKFNARFRILWSVQCIHNTAVVYALLTRMILNPAHWMEEYVNEGHTRIQSPLIM